MKKITIIFFLLFTTKFCLAQQSPDCQVKKITIYSSILKRGGNPCYKPSGDTIAYQKEILNLSNFILSTQIYISDTAMTVGRCLTCDTNTLPVAIRHDKYKGNAEYYHDGNYLLFTSENENGAHQIWNQPGAGVDNDIFIMNNSGTQFWRMTNIPAGKAILHPAFSPDGTKLFWAQMYYSTLSPPQGQEYGLWELKMADFAIISGVPQISNIVTFTPRDSVWYESHSFSPNNQFISFTSHQEDSSALYGDITVMDTADIGTTNFINLTNSPYIHDEHSHWSPDGNKISWMSGTYVGGLVTYKSELYLMDANGANPVQLTHFTNSSYPEYIQDTLVTADHYWSPDGKRIFGFVHFVNNQGWQSELYQLEFTGPCGMNPAAVQTNHSDASELKIYPNPAKDKLNISYSAATENAIQIDIYNVFGQIVLENKPIKQQGGISIDISTLPTGIYFVRVIANDNSVHEEKVIISR
jgi:hypothetical protein